MNAKYLYISFTITVVGLLLLAYASIVLQPPVSKIEDVDSSSLGKNLRVKGKVIDEHGFEGGSMSLEIKDETGRLKVYVPYHSSLHLNRSLQNRSIDVTGSIEMYRGNLEMVVSDKSSIRIEK